jgi:hypothetical protein
MRADALAVACAVIRLVASAAFSEIATDAPTGSPLRSRPVLAVARKSRQSRQERWPRHAGATLQHLAAK